MNGADNPSPAESLDAFVKEEVVENSTTPEPQIIENHEQSGEFLLYKIFTVLIQNMLTSAASYVHSMTVNVTLHIPSHKYWYKRQIKKIENCITSHEQKGHGTALMFLDFPVLA